MTQSERLGPAIVNYSPGGTHDAFPTGEESK